MSFVQKDENQNESGDASSFFYLLRFAKSQTWPIVGALAMLLGAGSASVGAARFLGLLVDRGIVARDLSAGVRFGVFVLGLELIAVVGAYFGRRALASAASLSLLRIREKLFSRLDDLPMGYFDRQPVGRIVTRLTYDVEGLEDFFSGTLARLLSALISLVAAMIGMALTDLHLSALLIATIIPSVFVTYLFRAPVRHWNREFARRNSAINAQLNEFLNGIPVIRSFGVEAWSQKEFDKTVEHHLEAAVMTNVTNAWSRPLILILCQAPLIVLLLYGGPLVLKGALTLGLLVAFKVYCDRVSRPMANIAQEIHTIQAAFTSAERVAVFLKEGDESKVLGADGKDSARGLQGSIEFKHVGMGYFPEQRILKDVSFTIPAGARVGLAGTTGSGKTTTVALLARLYEYQEGDILVDGRSIRDYDRSSLRDRMGFVSQDVVIFKGSVRENLACGRVLTDERIQLACRDTGLHHILVRNGMGLNSELLDKGQNLSLGERQLIALTRILLRDPAILVLDEATANIDPAFETLITEAVERVMKGRTCILIAHRIPTLRNCTQILVFRGGQLIEEGDHKSLVSGNGYYASLARGSVFAEGAEGAPT